MTRDRGSANFDSFDGDRSDWEIAVEDRIFRAGQPLEQHRDFRGRVLDEVARRDLVLKLRRSFWLLVLVTGLGLLGGRTMIDLMDRQANRWTFSTADQLHRRAGEIAEQAGEGPSWGLVDAIREHRRPRQ